LSGEPATTGHTFPAAADRGSIIDWAGVDYARISLTAKWTVHLGTTPLKCENRYFWIKIYSHFSPISPCLGDKAVEELWSSKHNLWTNQQVVSTTSSGNSRAGVEGSQEIIRRVEKVFFLNPANQIKPDQHCLI